MAKNNTANVSATKGVTGGYFFSAPYGTELPSDNTTALNSAFVNLGFISEDGITESIDVDSDSVNDLNGDIVCVTSSSRDETVTLKLIELKKDALAEIYGQDNVTDSNGLMTVKHASTSMPQRSYVLELLLKDGRKWRQVIPCGQVSEVGDLTLASSELAGREITISCNIDAELGFSVVDYIDSNETHK